MSYKERYEEYISSKEWKEKRKKVASERNFICEMCKKQVGNKFHVHHMTYKNFMNEEDEDLMLLCKECHEKIHYRENDTKNDDIIISKKLLCSNEFRNLTYSAQILYIQMKCWAHNKEKIYYSYSLAGKILKSKTTIKKAFEELESNNFIKKEFTKTTNLFTLLK